MKHVTAYCDGSGKGFLCALFDYGEGYQRCYFSTTDDEIWHEYRAVLFAVELMVPEYSYTLYSDHVGLIQHVTKEKSPPTKIIKYLVNKILKTVEHMDVEFKWMGREENLAGQMLDNKAREIYLKEKKTMRKLSKEAIVEKTLYPNGSKRKPKQEPEYENRGSSNNINRPKGGAGWFEKAWPPCPKCGGIIDEQGICEDCGFCPETGKVKM